MGDGDEQSAERKRYRDLAPDELDRPDQRCDRDDERAVEDVSADYGAERDLVVSTQLGGHDGGDLGNRRPDRHDYGACDEEVETGRGRHPRGAADDEPSSRYEQGEADGGDGKRTDAREPPVATAPESRDW